MQKSHSPFTFRRSIRLPGYDYRQAGIYFVTLCTYEKTKILGTIEEGEVFLSDLGRIVSEEWQLMAKARPNVQIDRCVVMPNHIHSLIIIEDKRAGDACSASPAPNAMGSKTLQAGSLGAIIGQFKAAVTRRVKSSRMNHDPQIWQRNYYEHIVRSERSLNDIRRYILENPAKWYDDSLFVE